MFLLFPPHRDVDTFVEKLQSTISFLTGIEENSNDDGDFVPFIWTFLIRLRDTFSDYIVNDRKQH